MTEERAEGTSRAFETARARRLGVRAALEELESAVAAPAASRSAEWAQVLGTRLAKLQEAFDHHVVAAEGEDGLLPEIREHAPRLSHRIDELCADHGRIRAATAAAIEAVRGPDPDQHVAALRDSVVDVMRRITHHRHLGADLVYEAFNVDIEAAD